MWLWSVSSARPAVSLTWRRSSGVGVVLARFRRCWQEGGEVTHLLAPVAQLGRAAQGGRRVTPAVPG
jgi:hypothetical protein